MFQFPSWFEHPLDFLASSFIHSRFDAVWAVGDSVCGDCVEQVFVELLASGLTSLVLKTDERLEGFEGLYCALEADCSRFDFVSDGGLCHDGAKQVVGQDVSPDFFMDELGRFASENVHLQSDFDVSEIKLLIPPAAIEVCQVFLCRHFGVEQCCDDDDLFAAKARLRHSNTGLSNFEIVRKRFVSLPVH